MIDELIRNLLIEQLDRNEEQIKSIDKQIKELSSNKSQLENQYKEITEYLIGDQYMFCKRCGKEKDETDFYRRRGTNRLRKPCIDCMRDQHREYYQRQKELDMESIESVKRKETKVATPKHSVEDVAVTAWKKGMSYGKYVAITERGMRCEAEKEKI